MRYMYIYLTVQETLPTLPPAPEKCKYLIALLNNGCGVGWDRKWYARSAEALFNSQKTMEEDSDYNSEKKIEEVSCIMSKFIVDH